MFSRERLPLLRPCYVRQRTQTLFYRSRPYHCRWISCISSRIHLKLLRRGRFQPVRWLFLTKGSQFRILKISRRRIRTSRPRRMYRVIQILQFKPRHEKLMLVKLVGHFILIIPTGLRSAARSLIHINIYVLYTSHVSILRIKIDLLIAHEQLRL